VLDEELPVTAECQFYSKLFPEQVLSDRKAVLLPADVKRLHQYGTTMSAACDLASMGSHVYQHLVLLIFVAVLESVHHYVACKRVLGEVPDISEEAVHDRAHLIGTTMLEEALEDTTAILMPGRLPCENERLQLVHDKLHFPRWHRHDTLLQDVVRIGAACRIPNVSPHLRRDRDAELVGSRCLQR
jgi:hypothetical protein